MLSTTDPPLSTTRKTSGSPGAVTPRRHPMSAPALGVPPPPGVGARHRRRGQLEQTLTFARATRDVPPVPSAVMPTTSLGAPAPPDEDLRLAAVHALALLDTPPEERFDRITRTARRALQVPMALVTLVDVERQWFKSCQGVDVRETDRSASFCAYAIHSDEAFVVTETHADPRFVDNALVVGPPFIRAYLGIPLHGAGGQRVGTL